MVRKTSTRSDATKNRTHILEIAEECFAAKGLEVPMDSIARSAGVGPGTLYRHFPNREALIAALVEERVGDLRQLHDDLLRSDEGIGERLDGWLDAIRTWMTSYDGLPGPLRQAWEQDATPLGVNCMQVIEMTEELLDVARRDGLARPDLSGRDLYLANLGAAWAASAPLADASTSKMMVNLIGAGWRNPVDRVATT